MNTLILLFSALSFISYGISCFFSSYLKSEFVRYGFSLQRPLIGLLQILGSLSLMAGLWNPMLIKVGSGGIALMMVIAIFVRIRIKDSFAQTLPAILYFGLNFYLFFTAR